MTVGICSSFSDSLGLEATISYKIDLNRWHRVVAGLAYSADQDVVVVVGGSTRAGKSNDGLVFWEGFMISYRRKSLCMAQVWRV